MVNVAFLLNPISRNTNLINLAGVFINPSGPSKVLLANKQKPYVMKKIRITVMAMAACFSFYSCSDDDNDNGNENLQEDLTGTYELSKMDVPTAQDFDNDGDTSTNLVSEGTCYNSSWISFKSDGTYQQYVSWSTAAEGGATLDCESEMVSGTYTQTGNAVTTVQTSGGTDWSATYVFDAEAHTLSTTQLEGTYAGWNSVASLFTELTGNLELEFKKYTENENDNGTGQDDDSNVNGSAMASVTGDFDLNSFMVGAAQDLNGDGETSGNLVQETDCYGQSNLTLNTDGTFEQTWNYVTITNLGTELSCESETRTGWWTRQGDSIILNHLSGTSNVASIFSFNANGETLTQVNNDWEYPGFNSVTSLFTMLSGTVDLTYAKQ